MPFQHKDNTATLFPNKNKTEINQRGKSGGELPDWTGSGKHNGQEVQISAWEKVSDKGRYLSISFSAPYVPNQAGLVPQLKTMDQAKAVEDDQSPDIPF